MLCGRNYLLAETDRNDPKQAGYISLGRAVIGLGAKMKLILYPNLNLNRSPLPFFQMPDAFFQVHQEQKEEAFTMKEPVVACNRSPSALNLKPFRQGHQP